MKIASKWRVYSRRSRTLNTLSLIILTVLLGSSGQLLMKKGALEVGEVLVEPSELLPLAVRAVTTPVILLGLAMWVLAALLWLYVLTRVDLSFAYPMLSLGYVIVFAGSWILFKEPVSLVRVVGAVIVVIGVILISRS